MSEKPRCSVRLYGRWRAWGGSPCGNAGKVERDGKWYCGTHDPIRVEAKRKKRTEKWNAEWDAKQKAREEAAHKREIVEQKVAMFDELVERLSETLDAYRDLYSGTPEDSVCWQNALATLAKAEKLK